MMGLNYEKANHSNTLYHEIYTTVRISLQLSLKSECEAK